jgi:adenylate kinase
VNIILFGPPGAGKGTQASFIAKKFNLHKVSTGDMLREVIEKNTPEGKEIKKTIDKGFLASDEIINNLISKVLSNKLYKNRLIFDGYPRSLPQAKMLDLLLKKNNQSLSRVLSLEVDKDTIVKRILGRESCSKCGLIFNRFFKPATEHNHKCEAKFLINRADDNSQTASSRFETYIQTTLPIIDFYKKQNLLTEINGKQEISQLFEQIRGILTSLEG